MTGPVGSAFIIHSSVCGSSDQTFLAQLINISVFMSGLCTMLQVTVGVRSMHVSLLATSSVQQLGGPYIDLYVE